MRKYKLTGLTGRSGSGKGIAREVFEEYGYKIIDADFLAREVIKNPVLVENIKSVFGADLVENGEVNRKELASRAFKTPEDVKTLNAIFHPHITVLFIETLKELRDLGADKILFDAPQLFEADLDVLCDVTVALISDDERRIKRLSARDNISEETAENRLKIQLSDSFFRENCDYCIENNSSVEKLRADLAELISRF